MAQRLKEKVFARIRDGALAVFATKGFAAATMAEIGKAAGVSTGNIYRYYPSKERLLDAVIRSTFVDRFLSLLRQRVDALRGVADLRALEQTAPFHLVSAELLDLCIDSRLELVFLLSRAAGTRYEGFAEEVVQMMVELAIAHFRVLDPGREVTERERYVLALIYRNWVRALVAILVRYRQAAQIRRAVDDFTRYHLAGLNGLFDLDSEHEPEYEHEPEDEHEPEYEHEHEHEYEHGREHEYEHGSEPEPEPEPEHE